MEFQGMILLLWVFWLRINLRRNYSPFLEYFRMLLWLVIRVHFLDDTNCLQSKKSITDRFWISQLCCKHLLQCGTLYDLDDLHDLLCMTFFNLITADQIFVTYVDLIYFLSRVSFYHIVSFYLNHWEHIYLFFLARVPVHSYLLYRPIDNLDHSTFTMKKELNSLWVAIKPRLTYYAKFPITNARTVLFWTFRSLIKFEKFLICCSWGHLSSWST